jgi:hypothetical protein
MNWRLVASASVGKEFADDRIPVNSHRHGRLTRNRRRRLSGSQQDYCVVANSRNITAGNPFPASAKLALVAGDIDDPNTSAKITDAAIQSPAAVQPGRLSHARLGTGSFARS